METPNYDEWFNSLPTLQEAELKGTVVVITFEQSKARCEKQHTEKYKETTLALAKLIKAGKITTA